VVKGKVWAEARAWAEVWAIEAKVTAVGEVVDGAAIAESLF